MLFDTDVLIWFLRGNAAAAKAIDDAEGRFISVISFMELMQGVRNKREMREIRNFLSDLQFQALPLTQNTGHRASIYMEEYVLTTALSMPDALIAATAVEQDMPLLSSNRKHYRMVKELRLKVFKP